MTKEMKLVNAFLAAAAVSALALPVEAAEGDRDSLAFRQSITDGSPYGTDIRAGMERGRGVEAPKALDPRAREFQRQLSASDGESLGL